MFLCGNFLSSTCARVPQVWVRVFQAVGAFTSARSAVPKCFRYFSDRGRSILLYVIFNSPGSIRYVCVMRSARER